MNAAVWFGSAVFFMVGAGPALQSPEVQQLLGSRNFPFYGGAIGHALAARFFHLQFACAILALLHLGAEWIYLSKSPRRGWIALLLGLFFFALAENIAIQPRLRLNHLLVHGNTVPAAQREKASRTYSLLHSTSWGLNLLATLGVAVYVWHMASQPPATRFVSTAKFRS